jgi:tetratricopeptide (TPR) repeat protein
MMRTKFGLLIFGLSLLVPALVFGDADKGSKFFEQATNAYREGNFEKAIELLDKAYEHKQDLAYKYNRILALQKMRHYGAALDTIENFKSRMKDDKRFKNMDKLHSELKSQLKKSRRDASSSARELANHYLEETLDKTSRVAARRVSQSVIARSQQVIPPETQSPDKTEPEPKATPVKRRTKMEVRRLIKGEEAEVNKLGWSLLSVGGITLAGGLLFGSELLLPGGVKDRIDCYESAGSDQVGRQNCYDNTDNTPGDDKQMLNVHKNLTYIMLGLGTAATTGGILSFVLEGSADNNKEVTVGSSHPTLRVSPVAGRDILGGILSIEF